MKLTRTVILVLAVLCFIPASSYAIVDIGVYGGYSFAGKLEWDTIDKNVNGWEYGVLGHINHTFLGLLELGIGGYAQWAPLKYSVGGKDYELTKSTYGIDGLALLDLPVFPLNPYVRGGIGVYEQVKVEAPVVGSETKSEYFKSYYFGGGIALGIFPFVQIFGEYLYTRSKQEDGVTIKGNAVHMGARLNI
jgi:hypothetical protein